MALKSYNPVTPSQRQLVLVDRSGLYRGAPVKTLTEGKNSSGGRNNNGRITVRFRGGGHKQAYRKIDFKRRKFDVPAKVERIEYDPNRTGFIALIKYEDGELAYILAPQRLVAGRHRRRRRACRRQARQRHAGRQHSDRHHRAQYRDQDRQGRPDRALGRHLCPDRRPRRRLRHPAAQLGRAAPRARPLHGDHRRGVQPRQYEHLDRQGRSQALDGPHAAQPRRVDEPDRSSAWRRRGPHLRRPASGDALGLSRPRARRPAGTSPPPSSSFRAATRGRSRQTRTASWRVRFGRARSSTAIC